MAEVAPPATFDFVFPEPAKNDTIKSTLFSSLDDNALLSVGVPADWLADVRAADEDGFFTLAAHLPAEASEALLEFAATGKLALPAPPTADPFKHPDALRRIRPIAGQEELEQALAFPWEKWGVFLHPSQRALVERSFSGPARVAGSAGTGKTIVAIHRAVRLARENPAAKILLASFSQPLADALAKKLLVLAPETGGVVLRITTASFRGIAEQMYQLEHGVRPRIASDVILRERLRAAAAATGLKGFSERFLLSEWTNVVDAWGLSSLDAYSTVERMGRKSRLGPNQRAPQGLVDAAGRGARERERYTTWANVFAGLAGALESRTSKPFDHVIIDEAQDLAPAELRFFASLAPAGPNGLFLSERYRSAHLPASVFVGEPRRRRARPVCMHSRFARYRTSQQIRRCCRPAFCRPSSAIATAWMMSAAQELSRYSMVPRPRSNPSPPLQQRQKRSDRRSKVGSVMESHLMKSACSCGRRNSLCAHGLQLRDCQAPPR